MQCYLGFQTKQWDRTSFTQCMVKTMCVTAGVPPKTNHSLGATSATEMFQAGVCPLKKVIQKRSLHQCTEALRLYKRISDEQQKAATAVLSPLTRQITAPCYCTRDTCMCKGFVGSCLDNQGMQLIHIRWPIWKSHRHLFCYITSNMKLNSEHILPITQATSNKTHYIAPTSMHIVRIMLKEECLNVVARLKHSKASSHSVLCAYFTSGRCTLNRVYCTLCTLPLIIYYYLCKGYNLKYRYTETQFLECPISSIVPLSRPGFHTFADKVNRS